MSDTNPITVPAFSRMVVAARDDRSPAGAKISLEEYAELLSAWKGLVDPATQSWFQRTVNGVARGFVGYAGGSGQMYLLDCIAKGQDYETFAKPYGAYASLLDQIVSGELD